MRNPHTPGRRLFRNYARFGIACTALIYLLMGTLTGMAALGLGGERADQRSILFILHRQPFGRWMLAVLVVGLGGYVLWRLDQALADPAEEGRGLEGLGIRIIRFASAGFYGTLAWSGVRLLASGARPDDSEPSVHAASLLLHQPYGAGLLWALSAALIAAGALQFHRALSGRYRKRIHDPDLKRRHPDLIRWTGILGFSARGVVFLVGAYMFARAGTFHRPGEARGTEGALDFVQSLPSGPLLLAVVAGGLAAYGIFLALQALTLQEDLAG